MLPAPLFIMIALAIIIATYTIGYLASYTMLRTEHASEGRSYTYGLRIINLCLSILSWIMVVIILINAWIKMIRQTGFWNKQIK